MKHKACAWLLCALLTGAALAQPNADDDAAHPGLNAAPAAATSDDLADVEVRKIDQVAGKVTLRHGEIKTLGMPSMTMVFKLRQPSLLDPVRVGDREKFRLEKAGGVYVATLIEAAK